MKIFFSFFLFLCFTISTYACPFTSTSLQGGGTLNAHLCVGDSETFVSGPTGCSHPNSTHEWVIKRAIYSTGLTNYQPYQTAVQNGSGPLTFTFNEPGRYEITLVIRNPNNFNQIDAHPCSGTGTCTRANVWVYGPVEPAFTVDQISCNYDPVTAMYTSTVSILPDVDQSGSHSSLNGTRLDIDWGDGNTEWTRIYWNTNYTPISHTYTWHASNIAPTIIAVNASGVCPDKGYSTYYTPVSEYYDITPTIIESNCERQIVCFEGIPPDFEIGLYGPNGEIGRFQECIEFWQSGTYSIVIYSGSGCPQVYQYTVNIQADPGVFSIAQPSVKPGEPLDLSLTGYNGAYIAYEILVTNCNGAPEWVMFEYGPANVYDNHNVHPGTTQQFLPCMLTDDFEFCFRARVLCGPFDPETYKRSIISNEICLKICTDDTEGIDDNDDPAYLLGGNQNDSTEELADIKEAFKKDYAEFKIYPNPTTDKFFIEMDAIQLDKTLSVQVINLTGQTVWQSKKVNTDGTLLEIDISQQPAGMYHVLISDDTKMIKTSAIIKMD